MSDCDCRTGPRCGHRVISKTTTCERPAGHEGPHWKCIHFLDGTVTHRAYEEDQ